MKKKIEKLFYSFCKGMNNFNQIDSSLLFRTMPQQINLDAITASSGARVTRISTGCEHSLLLTSDNQLFAWGSNGLGQL